MKGYICNIVAGYRRFFLKVCTALVLLSVCLLFSFCVVYPLWFLATRYTTVYSAVTLVFLAAVLLISLVKRSIKKYKKNPQKFLHSLVKKFIFLADLSLFFVFLFTRHRSLAFLTLVLLLAIYGFTAFGYSADRKPH